MVSKILHQSSTLTFFVSGGTIGTPILINKQMSSDLTNTLIGCQDPNPQVRTAAEAALASAEQSNLAEFFLALGKEVSLFFINLRGV